MTNRITLILLLSVFFSQASVAEDFCGRYVARIQNTLGEGQTKNVNDGDIVKIYMELLGELPIETLLKLEGILDKGVLKLEALNEVLTDAQLKQGLRVAFELVSQRRDDKKHLKLLDMAVLNLIEDKKPREAAGKTIRRKRSRLRIKSGLVLTNRDPLNSIEYSRDGNYLLYAGKHVQFHPLRDLPKPRIDAGGPSKGIAQFIPGTPNILVSSGNYINHYKKLRGQNEWLVDMDFSYKSSSDEISSIQLSPDGKFFSITDLIAVRLFDFDHPNPLRLVRTLGREWGDNTGAVIDKYPFEIVDDAFLEEGWRVLAKPKEDGVHHFHYVLNGDPGFPHPLETYYIDGLSRDGISISRFLRGHNKIIIGGLNGEVYLVQRTKSPKPFEEIQAIAQLIHTFEPPFEREQSAVVDFDISADGEFLAVINQFGNFAVIEMRNRNIVAEGTFKHSFYPQPDAHVKIKLSPDTGYVAIIHGKNLYHFDLEDPPKETNR